MAHKRMFSKDITGSDAFREMPPSSQALYFHLGMEADDDGFLDNYKGLMRAMNASEDDLKILLAKRFIILFPTKVIVVKHWLINNTIRKDRYNETKHLDEKRALVVKENGSYTELSVGKPSGNQLATQKRIEEDRKGEIPAEAGVPFSSKEYIKTLRGDPKEHIKLIGYYFHRRGLEFDTHASAQVALKRHLRAALEVVKFSKEKINEAIKKCEEMEGIDWTVGTILKMLTK